MKILGVETSSPLFSLCVCEDDKLIYEIRKNRLLTENRDAQFFVEAKKMLEYYKKDRLGAIAVSIGPGMFTSLRMGLTLAKGLALAQNIPIVAVNSLDAIGFCVSFLQYPVLVVINAYHQEIYASLYKDGRRTTDYLLTTPEEVKHNIIKEETVVVGSGVEVFKQNGLGPGTENLHFLNGDFLLLDAFRIVKIALPQIRSNKFDKPEVLEPFYIKKTDAERNYDKTDAVR